MADAVPPNLIDPHCTRITPQLLPLITLTQDEIDSAVATVSGGVANVQDIYPLAPLQHGMLFHHLAQAVGDTYVSLHLLAFDARHRLDCFLRALQSVVNRHDILRTGFAWQGLSQPVQVVWRRAPLPIDEVALEGPDVARQLRERFDPRHTRLALTQAPLLRAHVAHDAQHDRWLLCLLQHHAIGDHTTLELLIEEVQAHLASQQHRLPPPLPFRTFIAQMQHGPTPQQHEAFFKEMLACSMCTGMASPSKRPACRWKLGWLSNCGSTRAAWEWVRPASSTWRGPWYWRARRPATTWSSPACSLVACRAPRVRTACWACSSTPCPSV
jgi:hypothetical protein